MKHLSAHSLFLILSIFILNSCGRDPALFKVHNLNGDVIGAFGHGGMGPQFKYPIDTWESFEPLLRIGGEGTDLDMQMTKDSVLVFYHHHKLEDGTGCSGTINDKLWSEIWGCHFASPYSSTLNLVSGDEFFGSLVNDPQQYTFTFDCKLYSNDQNYPAFLSRYANALLKLIDDHQLMNSTMIESQDTTFLRMLQQKRPGLKLFIYPRIFKPGFPLRCAWAFSGSPRQIQRSAVRR